MSDRSDLQWYRDAVIYQVHVKSFFDSNDNGIGDFAGLTMRLDYIKDLGATAIWVMPFYPSPLRDDGYDIADYRGINPSYGSMKEFRAFIKEAHRLGLRVITELVINHTSDQHPWFQKARAAKPGSAARNFYVWSDTDQKYKDARVIFNDTEKSNWTWDPVAKAYFWHRFYSHQPDLNFDNPAVLRAVLDAMRYWLDMGVDGLRLDAIPYLVERDGTICDNLPETHAVIKEVRAVLDREYPGVMLLAEANQWPEETAEYFGKGDEAHMAFHFPLMPRMYMAIAQEDRHPITDIMRQTPEIPDGTQWAIFLRNHDELTLEMVTDKERDYLWSFYAADRRARINLGIRRRLAPLLENDRRKTELMMSLLLSMPGTPVLYYGDEIGMGDNIYLGDRDGVRTPMQWSPDRNGGFSKADPQRLFLPAIQDPVYGFQTVNVEAQRKSPTSLLNWTRRMLAIRQGQQAFGRGALRFLYPSNRKILAYVREFGEARFLCIANVSRTPQAVELDLSDLKGFVPIEMTGGERFPAIGELPYLLTLQAYGFYWFQLAPATAEQARAAGAAAPELFTLVLTGGPDTLFKGRERQAFEKTMAPRFLATQRWFAGKRSPIAAVKLRDFGVLPDAGGKLPYLLPTVSVDLRNKDRQDYFIPLAILPEGESEALMPFALARVRRGARTGLLYGAGSSADFALSMIGAIARGLSVPTEAGGSIRFAATSAFPQDAAIDPATIRRFGGEQSNTTISVGTTMSLKLFRLVQPGIHPEIEVGRYLTEVAGYRNVPALYGWIEEHGADGAPVALGVLQAFVRNQGDAAAVGIEGLKRELDTMFLTRPADAHPAEETFGPFVAYSAIIGRRTGELHVALAAATDDPAFVPEPLTQADIAATAADTRAIAEQAFASLEALRQAAPPLARDLLRRRAEVLAEIDRLAVAVPGAIKSRIHADYHLGQVLIAQDDVVIVDFEGEPGRPPEQRRAKASPLRDVAGMLRSFDYAAETAVRDLSQRSIEAGPSIAGGAAVWKRLCQEAFLAAYRAAVEASPAWVADDAGRERLLRFFVLSRALYEIVYEGNNRPDWIETPVKGVLALLDQTGDGR